MPHETGFKRGKSLQRVGALALDGSPGRDYWDGAPRTERDLMGTTSSRRGPCGFSLLTPPPADGQWEDAREKVGRRSSFQSSSNFLDI